ncbi:MAG: hypothetical protein QHJ81_11370 [Anaerolineae bacterium]|nr:hypothetical protein [Anaerolineae bacterium]
MNTTGKTWKRIVLPLTLALVGALGLGGWLAIHAYAQGPRGGYGGYSMMGPGMMGSWGREGYGINPATGVTGSGPYGGCPMHGGWNWRYPDDTGTPISMDQATEAVQRYLTAYGNPDLVLTEVMQFSNHFYAEVEEESTGSHAFELLVNRYTGAVYPEPGPNMMWNLKYGHMGGMMGSQWGWPSGPMPVTPEQARSYARQWLDVNLPGTTVADEADAFYGYYTLHVLTDGKVTGMLSVNGYSGQVWYHTWHGDFVGMREYD